LPDKPWTGPSTGQALSPTLAMSVDSLETRRKRKLVFGVLVVGILASALVAIALFYMSKSLPRF